MGPLTALHKDLRETIQGLESKSLLPIHSRKCVSPDTPILAGISHFLVGIFRVNYVLSSSYFWGHSRRELYQNVPRSILCSMHLIVFP